MTQLIAVCTLARILAFKTCLLKKKLNRRGLKLLRHIGSFSVESGPPQHRGRFQYVIRTEELVILLYIQTAVARCARPGQQGSYRHQKIDVRVLQLPTDTLVFYYLESNVEWLLLLFFVLVLGSNFFWGRLSYIYCFATILGPSSLCLNRPRPYLSKFSNPYMLPFCPSKLHKRKY
jgi:hypothetical protein